jgi:hypothetical protein
MAVSTVNTFNLNGHVRGCDILMVDNDETIYIRYPDYTIKRVSPDGTVTHYAGLPDGGFGAPTNYADGTLATARFYNPQRMAKGPDGTLYVGEMYHIRAIRGQNVTTLAGRGEDSEARMPGEIRGFQGHDHIIDGPGPVAFISWVEDIWFDSDGRLMFWDEDILRTVAMDGTVTTVAYADAEAEREFENHATGQVMDKNGNAYYPSMYWDSIDGAAMIKKLPDGSKQAFGQLVAEGENARDGPLQTARFFPITSLGYDPGRERLYTMEGGVDFSLLRKITLGTPVTAQLMGEQLYRQSAVPLPPNVVQTISEFSGATNPKRVFLDAVKNRGVALPRAGRRTRRRKVNRKKKMTRKRRSTSS